MSFGGSVLAMITTLKNNARPRKKVFEYKKDHNTSLQHHYELKYKTVSAEKLEAIKSKIRQQADKEERQKMLKIMGFLLLFSAVAIIGSVTYLKNVESHNKQVVFNQKMNHEHQRVAQKALAADDFEYYLNYGYRCLEKADYYYAKISFAQARSLDTHNYEANLGLLKAYVKDCTQNQVKCEHAHKLLRYNISKFGLTEGLIDIQNEFNK